ncbi:hypothetical protein K435DRAFT_642713 [Dendrothele bispora CBS 962.96]|uniref:Signal recognition particle subunit SRP72 n=1 Tax=Dendrothele bispora (strain CBS 962.96) TaxID=1314807 RepID=A0A4V4HIV2_DENBC|nr:hypothetical protein K435DRAFT_642713 [Dendrothele bispora CBS 962.96]
MSTAKKNTKTTRKGPASRKEKQPLSTEERIKRHFNSLCAQIDGGHFTNAIKTCDKILRLDPTDPDALQTKLFLYLQTEQYAPALEIIASTGKEKHAFEKAYAYYRLQREDEASSVLEEIKEKNGVEDRGVMHLEAQLSYRQGSYQTAYDLYNQLLDSAEPHSEEHSDILTNLNAAQQHLDFISSGFLQGIDALPATLRNSIESLPPPPPSSQQGAAALSSISTAAAVSAEKAQTQKKPRARRVPAGVVPGVTPPPDPERWLKKSERSTFGHGHHGKKRKGTGVGGATQGASVDSVPAANSGGGGGGKKGKKRK